eukprot:2453078-Alexandrium_andersonii.AAC.1
MDTALQEVVFCVYEDHNAGHWRNPRGNIMEQFRDVFGLRHKHVRFARGTKPSAFDACRPPPQGA